MDCSELTSSRSFMQIKDLVLSQRRCLQVSAFAGCSMLLGRRLVAAEEPASADHSQPATIAPRVTGELRSLLERLAKVPRRRDFQTVPMLTNCHQYSQGLIGDCPLEQRRQPSA
jgi:hypothetical protein